MVAASWLAWRGLQIVRANNFQIAGSAHLPISTSGEATHNDGA